MGARRLKWSGHVLENDLLEEELTIVGAVEINIWVRQPTAVHASAAV